MDHRKRRKQAEMTSLFKNNYKEKTVLVTGHTGFKGGWLSLWLRELGARVIGFSLEPPSDPNFFETVDLKKEVVHVYGDIRSYPHLLEIFSKYQPEIVFHLAAQSLVGISVQQPRLTYETNVLGTVNLLEGVRNTPSVRSVVNVTSDKCYDNKEWVWGYREIDSLGGRDPYSSSKGCAELVFNAYWHSFFSEGASPGRTIGAASVRAGNVIGGGDWGLDRLLTDGIRSLSSQQPIPIRNPQAVRPWQYVLEPLSGYLWLGALLLEDPGRYSGVWNFGPEEDHHLTVAELADKLITCWGEGSWKDISDPKAFYEANVLKLNCDKAHSGLNWQRVLTIDESLQMTVDWYKKYYRERSHTDFYRLCAGQITQYVVKARRKNLSWTQ